MLYGFYFANISWALCFRDRKKEDPEQLLPISIIHGCDMDVDMDEDVDTYIDNLLGLVELSEELGESGIDN